MCGNHGRSRARDLLLRLLQGRVWTKAPDREPSSIDELLASRGVRVVDWAGWLRLDSHERALGEVEGRERVKVVPREEMLDISLGPVTAPSPIA